MTRSPLYPCLLVSLALGCAPAQLVRTERIDPGEECAAGGLAVHLGTDTNVDGILGDDEIATTDYVCDAALALVRVDAEPAGMNCQDGGIAVHAGLDLDGSGELDDAEITTTDYVCNAGAGMGPGQPLVEVTAEPAGENCADGGIAVTSGIDVDGNGVLEGEELLGTHYVCNGSSGVAGLVRIDEEPAGSNCDSGGLAIGMGLDLDASGELEPGEVVSTAYVCHGAAIPGGTLQGSFLVSNSYDAWVLSQYAEVTDWVAICSPALEEFVIPDLQRVGTDLWFNMYRSQSSQGGDCDTEVLSQVDMPALAEIGGEFYVPVSPGITDLSGFTALGDVGSDLWIYQTFLTSLDGLSALATVGGTVWVYDSDDLADISALGAMQSAGGLRVEDNDTLISLADFTALTSLDTWLIVQHNDDLEDLGDFPALTTIDGEVTIYDNPSLSDISGLSAVTHITGGVWIDDCPQLCMSDVNAWLAGVTVDGYVDVTVNQGC